MRKVFLIVSSIALMLLVFSCPTSTTPTPQGPNTPTSKLTIQFGSDITAKKGGQPITNGAEVAEGDVITFTTTVPSGQKIAGWQVNGSTVSGQTGTTFTYTVKKTDADTSGKITVAVVFESIIPTPTPKLTIQFGSDITAKKGGQSITSGAEVVEGDAITFTTTVPSGQKIAGWQVNGSTVSGQTGTTFTYTVKKTDADANGKINVAVVFVPISGTAKLTIQFGSDITAKKGGQPITSGAEVAENDVITFTTTVPSGKQIAGWQVKGSTVSGQTGTTFTYTVKKTDADANGKINVAVMFASESVTGNLKVHVIGFVGGSNVSGTRVEAYSSGNTVPKAAAVTNADGMVGLSLPAGNYTLKAIGNGTENRAESIIENVKVEEPSTEVVMIQRVIASGYRREAPKLTAAKWVKGTTISNDIADGNTVNGTYKKVFFKFDCPSAKISDASDDNQNFGVSIGVASAPDGSPIAIDYKNVKNPNTGISFLPKPTVITTETKQNADGTWTCGFGFDIDTLRNNLPTSGDETLYVVAYDTAGNRYEKRFYLKFTNNNGAATPDSYSPKVKNLKAEICRYAKPISTYSIGNVPSDTSRITVFAGEGLSDTAHTYGCMPHEGFETSLQAVLSFTDYSNKTNAFEIYKREYQAGAGVNDNWELVAKKINATTSSINNILSIAVVDGSLKEGTVYQFKLKTYALYSGTVTYATSDIATASTSFPFVAKLVSPHNNLYTLDEAKNIELTFQVSQPRLLSSALSDYFQFGISVKDKLGDTNNDLYFAKLVYDFTKSGDDALWIRTGKDSFGGDNYESFAAIKGRISSLAGKSVNDLVSIDTATGEITVKKAFLERKEFDCDTFNSHSLYDILESGHSYHWDVVDEGPSASSPYDDLDACRFVKKWQCIDASTGALIAANQSKSNVSRVVSYGNVYMGDGAINGRFAFSVK